MKFKNFSIKAVVLTSLCCGLLTLGGCSKSDKTTTAEVDAFNGNPNSPEAKAAAQQAASNTAARAAQARAQGQKAPATR